MASTKVASRYAKSIFGQAAEQGLAETISADMQLIENTYKNRDFAAFLQNPIIGTAKKQSVLKMILDGKVNALTLSFVNLVALKGREAYLPIIADQYNELYKASKGIQSATVTSAVPLDDTLRAQIKGIVSKIAPGSRVPSLRTPAAIRIDTIRGNT